MRVVLVMFVTVLIFEWIWVVVLSYVVCRFSEIRQIH